ncbi:hypothetical protein C8R43DRAFT_1042181 [Mycena crocata]|nr:hypothetical protein C8R43DRAFT_1042181 [Mycena crocata]
MYNISSPRAPRSSHHRSSSTRTSPRQQDRAHPYGGHRVDQPNYEGGPQPALVPENLEHSGEGDVFNVDPAAGILEAPGETYHQPVIQPAGRGGIGRFVGGFVRKALQRNRAPPSAEAEGLVALPQPAVIHEAEREYRAVPAGEPEVRYAISSPAARVASHEPDARHTSPSPSGRHTARSPDVMFASPSSSGRHAARPPEAVYAVPSPNPIYATPSPAGRYATSTDGHAAPGPSTQYAYAPASTDGEHAERTPHRRQESSASTAETAVHATQEHYDGTTIANHDPAQFASPEAVELQPASDYAKDSPPRSEASFGSYLTRVHHFFQMLNALPWIAAERVTVDYIPGRARRKEEMGNSTLRPRTGGARRPVISWYNSNVPQGSIDLLSSGTGSPLDEFAQRAQPYPDPDMVYANNKSVPAMPAGPPPMVGVTPRSAHRVPRVPVPYSPELEVGASRHIPTAAQYTPGPMQYTPSATYYTPTPRYPGGYVPYEQQDPAHVTQMYTGSSTASHVTGTGSSSSQPHATPHQRV